MLFVTRALLEQLIGNFCVKLGRARAHDAHIGFIIGGVALLKLEREAQLFGIGMRDFQLLAAQAVSASNAARGTRRFITCPR